MISLQDMDHLKADTLRKIIRIFTMHTAVLEDRINSNLLVEMKSVKIGIIRMFIIKAQQAHLQLQLNFLL